MGTECLLKKPCVSPTSNKTFELRIDKKIHINKVGIIYDENNYTTCIMICVIFRRLLDNFSLNPGLFVDI